MGQAYRRLGSEVTIVARTVLPKEEPEARESIERVFGQEGIRVARGRAISANRNLDEITMAMASGEVRGDMLLVASGRAPNVVALDLANAGVRAFRKGHSRRRSIAHQCEAHLRGGGCSGRIPVHPSGRMAGVSGGAKRSFPRSRFGLYEVLPRVTFTDPEVAQVGLTRSRPAPNSATESEVEFGTMK